MGSLLYLRLTRSDALSINSYHAYEKIQTKDTGMRSKMFCRDQNRERGLLYQYVLIQNMTQIQKAEDQEQDTLDI